MVDDGIIVGGFFAALGFALIIIGMQELAARLIARSEYQGRIEKNWNHYLGIFIRCLVALHATILIIVLIVFVSMGESRGGVIIAPIVYLVISYFFYYRFVR